MKALLLLADGFDEISSFTIIKILRMGGIELTVAGLTSTVVEGESGTRIIADKRLGEINTDRQEALVLPAGKCYSALVNSQAVLNLLKGFNSKNKFIAAIGESPAVLGRAGIIDGKSVTVLPSMKVKVPNSTDDKVAFDKNIITGRSISDSEKFSLKILEVFLGKTASDKVKKYLDEGI